jgi:hypothetical protein
MRLADFAAVERALPASLPKEQLFEVAWLVESGQLMLDGHGHFWADDGEGGLVAVRFS